MEVWKRARMVEDRKSGRGWKRKRKRRVAYLRGLYW